MPYFPSVTSIHMISHRRTRPCELQAVCQVYQETLASDSLELTLQTPQDSTEVRRGFITTFSILRSLELEFSMLTVPDSGRMSSFVNFSPKTVQTIYISKIPSQEPMAVVTQTLFSDFKIATFPRLQTITLQIITEDLDARCLEDIIKGLRIPSVAFEGPFRIKTNFSVIDPTFQNTMVDLTVKAAFNYYHNYENNIRLNDSEAFDSDLRAACVPARGVQPIYIQSGYQTHSCLMREFFTQRA